VEYERFVRYVAEELEMEISRRIPLYILDHPRNYCPSPLGCTKPDGTAFALPATTYHELAHAVACEIRVNGAPALGEGLAVSFEVTANDSMADPRSFLTLARAEFNPNYDEAGHFVRWLLEEFGPAAFKSIYRRAPMRAGEEVAVALEDTLGMSLDSLSEDYLAHAPKNWLPHRQCADLAVLPSNGSSWVFETRFDCEDESTLGPYERLETLWVQMIGAESMYQSFLIDVQTPGTHHVETSGLRGIFFEKCMESGDQAWNQNVEFFSIVNYGTLELDSAGLWRIDVLVDHGPATDVSLMIAPEG
jgi:hypothetical protein